ncbi:MAG: O-antigen ligase family protein [Acidobacteria bacterium]|nr:O-antigen ligase family protein [Acidobacteriota bacterium]
MTRTIDRAIWTSAAILSALFLPSIFHQPIGWAPAALVTILAIAAALRPYEALLVFAALGPLATMVFVLVRTADSNVRYHEATALAFLGGFAVRRLFSPRPSPLPPWLYVSVTALLALVLASGVVSAAIMVVEEPAWPLMQLLRNLLVENYLVLSNPITAAGLFAEGLLMLLAVADLCDGVPARRRDVARMLIIGAAAAAFLNIVRIVALALAREDPWGTFLGFMAGLRVNIHYSDLNAAGSYFAMALFVAIGLMRDSRVLAITCAGLIAAGLWMSGSRTGLAAVSIVVIAWGLRTLWRGQRRRFAVAGVTMVMAASVLVGVYYPRDRNATAAVAYQIRASLAKGALDMARAEPVFGVGVGRFYARSIDYTPRQHINPRENAHNNFLQVLAELGLPGLLLFVSLIGLALREGLRWARESAIVAGALAGVAAYLLTCLAGHPLLVDAAAYPFWIALALAVTPLMPSAGVSRRSMGVIVAVIIAIAASLPWRLVRADEHADLENASAGFSLWQREADGSRYRWTGGRATFFAPSSPTAVLLPLRAGTAASSPVEVRILVGERESARVTLQAGGGWTTARLQLPGRTDARFVRIDVDVSINGVARPADVKTTDTAGVLMVGRPQYLYPVAAGDYDADGRKDVAVFRPIGVSHVMGSATGTATETAWGLPGDIPVPGDYDGDGKTDHAVYRPSSSAWYVLRSATGTGVDTFWGIAGDVPVPADYDGDRKTDLAVYRPSIAVWYIVPSTTGTAYAVHWGLSGDLPIPADFDGDGKADPTVFRPSTRAWAQLRSTTGAGFAVVLGATGDLPFAGDYDGDGKADPTVFRPSSGAWYQLRSMDGAWFGGYWGRAGDVPIVGDYDGDGKADLTVFRPSTSTWHQLRSATGIGFAIVWGIPGDLPM